jgi:hypothetical protein
MLVVRANTKKGGGANNRDRVAYIDSWRPSVVCVAPTVPSMLCRGRLSKIIHETKNTHIKQKRRSRRTRQNAIEAFGVDESVAIVMAAQSQRLEHALHTHLLRLLVSHHTHPNIYHSVNDEPTKNKHLTCVSTLRRFVVLGASPSLSSSSPSSLSSSSFDVCFDGSLCIDDFDKCDCEKKSVNKIYTWQANAAMHHRARNRNTAQ